jgi:hypothetical protein
MKKSFLLVSLLVILSMLFATTQVMAAPKPDKPGNPTPKEKTPNPDQPSNPSEKGPKNGKPQNFKGTVTAVTDTGFTLLLADGTSVDLAVDASTQIKIPTLKNATLKELNLNVGAVVQARDDGTGKLVAKKVLVVPGKPVHFHRVGVVTDYQAGISITIKDKDDVLTTFLLTPDTKILPPELASTLAKGVTVTIISRRDPTGGALTAQGVVIHAPDETESGSEDETGEGG